MSEQSRGVSRDDVSYVADLARIELSDEAMSRFVPQLNKILEYVEKLNTLDTSGVEPTTNPMGSKDVYRDDAVKPSLETDTALRCAPRAKDGFFWVPRVIE